MIKSKYKTMFELIPSPKGRTLLMAGVMFFMVGLGNVTTANELKPELPSYQAYRAQFLLVEGLEFWGSLFMLAGVVAIFFSFQRDRYHMGYFAVMFMAMWWATLFLVSLIATGYTRIIPSIFVWGLISVFLYTISSWQEAAPLEN